MMKQSVSQNDTDITHINNNNQCKSSSLETIKYFKRIRKKIQHVLFTKDIYKIYRHERLNKWQEASKPHMPDNMTT